MIQQLGFCQFTDRFRDMGREDQFTYEGKKALFEYLTDYEEEMETSIELDVIALCCEFTEYDNLEELQRDFRDIETLNELRDRTTVIEFNSGSLIVGEF